MSNDYSLSEVEMMRRSFNTATNAFNMALMDTTNAPFSLLQENGALTQRTYLQAISEGDVSNHTNWSKIGYTGKRNS